MDFNKHTTPAKLEYYAFMWSLARMVIAAFSLFFGAMPIYYKISGFSSSAPLLNIAWIISGFAAAYLGYLWFTNDKKVFGTKDQKTMILFLIMVVTGLNLGWTGLASNNIGMGLVGYNEIAQLIFKATAVAYLFVAYSLWNAWKANGETLFATSDPEVVASDTVIANQTSSEEVQAPKLQSGEDQTDQK